MTHHRILVAVVTSALLLPALAGQPTICEIVKNPVRFSGKQVRVRARISPASIDAQEVWMADVAATPAEIGRTCDCLLAKFANPSELTVSTALGMFTGRIVLDAAFNQSHPLGQPRVLLVVTHTSDIHAQRLSNGPQRRSQGCAR